MFRKLIATILLALMTMVTATSQGRLTYCLCLNTLAVGQCACEVELAPEPDVDDHACHCCEQGSEEEPIQRVVHDHDCTIDFSLEVDAFCWSPDTSSPVRKETMADDDMVTTCKGVRDQRLPDLRDHTGVKRPPDPGPFPSMPLYLRHLVFLV